jgi:hypothetical protein
MALHHEQMSSPKVNICMQDQMGSCVDECLREYRDKVPALKQDLEAALGKIKRQ